MTLIRRRRSLSKLKRDFYSSQHEVEPPESSLTRGCKVTSALRVGHTSRGSFLGAEQEPPAAAAESSDSERSLCRSAVPAATDGKAPGMGHSLRAAALLAFVVLSVLVSLLITSLKQFGSGSTRFFNATNPEELRRGLDVQLRERRKEILPLLLPHAADDDDEKNGVLEEVQHSSDSALDLSLWNEVTLGTGKAHRDQMGCESLVDVRAVEVLGSGYTKLVVKANVAGGQAVALKMVNEQGVDMRKCLKEFRDAEGCRELVSYKLQKEMLLLQRLRHPNVIKLKGHCSGVHGGGEGGGVERGRVAVILEQGTPLQMIQLLQTPWEDRFRVCLDLVRLLHFLSRSPLGSVGLLDFQPRQFVTVSGQLKLTDLDDVSAGELACRTHADCTLKFPHRNFTVLCSTQGVCDGLNEKRNIYNAYRFFFTYLLPHQAPPGLTHLVDHIMNTTGELKADINQTLEAFEHILLLYKLGLHLDNLHPSALRDYTVMRDMSTSGNGEYRCWPSYSQQGCVLSVHSAREAAHICNSHSQCSSFTLTGQKTWTGHHLASFRSSFGHLVPDSASEVYVKKSRVPQPPLPPPPSSS
ncbi:PREDICTED: extracellular tyrosine-protein kinase PKDCC [Poecilia mexicana]|uniref:Protein kinase domain-containing protein n=1 Tax=Poecilia mexicana TaxID=48701 RepID=A0A3B3WZ92_9TELE|nr:PREDICTED: extracellular tyrosine-protein kinase PKDCC [Poecilia mexicana]